MVRRLFNLLWAIVLLALALVVLAHLAFFAVRTGHLLAYPFPLDYGEGPLQAQLLSLWHGIPIWGLYADPGAPPYAVVNYPPIYHLATYLLSLMAVPIAGDLPRGVLLAGRLVSLAAGILSAVAIWALARGSSTTRSQPPASEMTMRPSLLTALSALLPPALVALAFLGIPIVREWSSVMRVDLLGICLGLWGLVLVQRGRGRSDLAWAALLLALALLTKPSLLAAPAAAFCWLLFRSWRRGLLLGALVAGIGGGVVGALQVASGGWFWLHAVAANANPWDFDLAHGFWRDQFLLMQPLILAGALAVVAAIWGGSETRSYCAGGSQTRPYLFFPLYYTLFGLIAAFGVGKYGAYANYFLEAYAGLFWLAASACAALIPDGQPQARPVDLAPRAASLAILGLAALSLARYYPLWSEEYLLPAGIIEGRNPARVSIGGYGVWQDLQREGRVLDARGRINQALLAPVRAAGGAIYTDVPGVAAQAGAQSRIQVFEHRMLIDPGLWDERALLRDLANGQVPLLVLDYLGNWMTTEQIAIITRRYAQDVSVGLYSIYRPVDPGPRQPIDLAFAGGLRASAVSLTRPGNGRAHNPGEMLAVTIEWQAQGWSGALPDVVLQLTDAAGRPLLATVRPLLYGALPPDRWDGQAIQHMQPLALPPELPPGDYQIALVLRGEGIAEAPARPVAALRVVEGGGRLLGEQGMFVPEPLLAEWGRLGGYDGPGDPISPAVPFEDAVLQCYRGGCLRLGEGGAERLPVGELVWMGEAGLPRIPGAPPDGQLSPAFQALYDQMGGEAALGPPLGGEMKRFGDIVQYTRYARLERPLAGGPARLGTPGDEIFRLPGGLPYRWPSP